MRSRSGNGYRVYVGIYRSAVVGVLVLLAFYCKINFVAIKIIEHGGQRRSFFERKVPSGSAGEGEHRKRVNEVRRYMLCLLTDYHSSAFML